MKNTFSGFYSASTDELNKIWNSRGTVFIFDTNCLLNLYRCEKQTREEILSLMDNISERMWLPFHVGLEYQRNRKKVIHESLESLKKIESSLVASTNLFDGLLSQENIKKHLYSPLSKEIRDFKESVTESIDIFVKSNLSERIEDKKNLSKSDFIRTQIDKIVNSNHGTIPSQEKIDIINNEGEDRYSKKIPPGFKDAKKEQTFRYSGIEFKGKFGDLYIWKEIIEKAKEDNVENIIFVCDDVKEDWWFELGGERHGALEELQTEITSFANLNYFKLMTQSTFLFEAKEYLSEVTISDSSVEETQLISSPKSTVKFEEGSLEDFYDNTQYQGDRNKNHAEGNPASIDALKGVFIEEEYKGENIFNFYKESKKNQEIITDSISKHFVFLKKFDEIISKHKNHVTPHLLNLARRIKNNQEELMENLNLIKKYNSDRIALFHDVEHAKFLHSISKQSLLIIEQSNYLLDKNSFYFNLDE